MLAGTCPIDPETARRLAGNTPGLDRVMAHPMTGTVLHVDRYRPSEPLTRYLRARDTTCRFPGCRQAAHRCDLDHTHDAAFRGSTTHDNLAHLCRRHHSLKHNTPWTVKQVHGGHLIWTAPSGRRYTDVPATHATVIAQAAGIPPGELRTVRFTPDPASREPGRSASHAFETPAPPDTPEPRDTLEPPDTPPIVPLAEDPPF